MSQQQPSRFIYNQGVYRIRRREGSDWINVGQVFGTTFANASIAMQDFVREDPSSEFSLCFLEEDKDGKITWRKASLQDNYNAENREKLHQIFYELGLELDEHGYQTMSKITGISPHTLRKVNRRADDQRATPLTNNGLLYIRYCVQQYQKGEEV